jgi:hypothetical protein
MGLIEPMAIVSAAPSVVIPFGASVVLWTVMIGILVVSAGAIALSRPRPRRAYPALRLATLAEAN